MSYEFDANDFLLLFTDVIEFEVAQLIRSLALNFLYFHTTVRISASSIEKLKMNCIMNYSK